jgi:hypothetical protein
MRPGPAGHLAAGIAIGAVSLTTILQVAAALEPPSADDIVGKFLAMRASAPRILLADILVALRYKTPLTAPPNCIYAGTLRSNGGRYDITIQRETRHSTVCWFAEPHRDQFLGALLETLQTLAPLPDQTQASPLGLDQFDMAVRDQKVIGRGERTDWVYLLEGRGNDPHNDLRAFREWIDYDAGLWLQGTLTYSWGQVDTKQDYTRLQNVWVLTYQYLYSKQYDASLEVLYSNFQFAP